ncbi:sushi domain-containing protein 5 [Ornithorhynchus anatinus]|uniref:sushi domain-containing protein 5 n=1 Tax=Ornithorhynchus anatinus TaxID=9258 RepID=UPI0010A931AD|nr:sushi domain-containing protein 5 [Ornithorhynchus anatinus]
MGAVGVGPGTQGSCSPRDPLLPLLLPLLLSLLGQAAGKLFTLEPGNGSQGLDLPAARASCGSVGARLATAEELRRAVLHCAFTSCSGGWLADGTIGSTVCRPEGSEKQNPARGSVQIERNPIPSRRYNALCIQEEEKPCGDPPSFPHTILHGHTGFEMGDELLYICAQGYVMGRKESAFTLLCDGCGKWYGQVQACVKDKTEAHIDYEENFPEERSEPLAGHKEDAGGEEEEEEEEEGGDGGEKEDQRQGVSISGPSGREDLVGGGDTQSQGSAQVPAEFPDLLLSQKGSFWYVNGALQEPTAEASIDAHTDSWFSEAPDRLSPKGDLLEPSTQISSVQSPPQTHNRKGDEAWLDGFPVTPASPGEGEDTGDETDGSVGMGEGSLSWTDRPNHVEVRKPTGTGLHPDDDIIQRSLPPTRTWAYGAGALTSTGAPENVSPGAGVGDGDGFWTLQSRDLGAEESPVVTEIPDRASFTPGTATTAGSWPNHFPSPSQVEETTSTPPVKTTWPGGQNVFPDPSSSKESVGRGPPTPGRGEMVLPTAGACGEEPCVGSGKGPAIALLVIVLSLLLLLAAVAAGWCYRKRRQTTSVYRLKGQGQARPYHQQIEMQKV